MNRSTLYLTTKDNNRNRLLPLTFDMQWIKEIIKDETSLYYFRFDLNKGNNLDFGLIGDDCTTFFSLLDQLLTPNPAPVPPVISTVLPLTPTDVHGNPLKPGATLAVTLQKLQTFVDKISLFSYTFVREDGTSFTFNLTSTDAGAMFYSFDSILWSNPPNPDH